MKKVAAILSFFIFFATIPVFAQNTPELKCPEVRFAIQHKKIALKLTFSGTAGTVINEDGAKRCVTTDEIIKQIHEAYPDYFLAEYWEQSLNK